MHPTQEIHTFQIGFQRTSRRYIGRCKNAIESPPRVSLFNNKVNISDLVSDQMKNSKKPVASFHTEVVVLNIRESYNIRLEYNTLYVTPLHKSASGDPIGDRNIDPPCACACVSRPRGTVTLT